MSYRHGLVDVLDLLDDMVNDAEESIDDTGENPTDFSDGYLAALDQFKYFVAGMLAATVESAEAE